jgi:NAD(P)-dependent dehydrogenase (short-subunit alcohol dehydrogenase family)
VPRRAILFGAGGGLGAALAGQLVADPAYDEVWLGARSALPAGAAKIRPFRFDSDDEASLAAAAGLIGGELDLVFVATGLLHREGLPLPEKSFRSLDPAAMAELYRANAIGPAMIAKHFLPLLPRSRRAVFAVLSARVGSIADNRLGGWHSYRAAKAALNMLVQNFAIELGRSHPQAVVAALHPGTVDTPLSRPFQRGLPEGQVQDPDGSAKALLATLERLTPEQSGGLYAWDGTRLPW